jgi:stalled ribosome rescue protein Dom34
LITVGVIKKKMRKKQKRGNLIALLIGYDDKKVYFWKIYSHSLRAYETIILPRKWRNLDDKQMYNLLENVIDVIRTVVRDGLKSVLIASSNKKEFWKKIMDHVAKHHYWLLKGYNRVSFGEIIGNANSLESAKNLVSKEESKQIVTEVISEEIYRLEKIINTEDLNAGLLYNLDDIESIVYEGGKKDKNAAKKLDLIIITQNYIDNQKNKNRIHRLSQIANNKGIKVKIISIEDPSVDHFDQFGGILAFKKEC